MAPNPNGSWDEYRMHVVNELRDLKQDTRAIYSIVNKHSTEITGLKVRAGIWGLIGSAIVVATALLLRQLGVIS